MPNKELRIIIADANLSRQIQIEKSLNRLGYHRILPVQCCKDLARLSDAFLITFDVLIANKDLARDADNTLTVTDNINHALLYGSQHAELTITSFSSTDTRLARTTTIPGDELLANFMARIDPPSPWECLKDVAWIKKACAPKSQLLASKGNETRMRCTAGRTIP
ncbi:MULTISPECIES: histidine kinase [Pseudomonas]|uniref:Histidine kinase n=1 Tax=Pseudomonas cedrina TaxID=651740 RepID=A0A2S9D5F8_PSECE|nr:MULTISPECIES: histidine kinase [Pseudomonas]AVJ22731.1 histidine kinase [Pseudomonas sp. MYb193]PRB90091.1 histidine kinase [Pseudomonas cedrina]